MPLKWTGAFGITALFVLGISRPPENAWAQQARRAVSHKNAHGATACATSLSACPPEGCSTGDPLLNTKKNRLDAPVGAPQEFTFEDFIHLESERPGPGE